jgi:hypothetical protein
MKKFKSNHFNLYLKINKMLSNLLTIFIQIWFQQHNNLYQCQIIFKGQLNYLK